jgi:deoxyribonuclease IV
MVKIKFGPSGLGPVKDAISRLEEYHTSGLEACELAFVRQIYIKKDDAVIIGEKAKDLGIYLSVHAQYYVNLNSKEKEKIEASKKRILNCCEIAHYLGAKRVIFHPGFYSDMKSEDAREIIKKGILEMQTKIKKNNWDVELCPEVMGKINVFGSIDEISWLIDKTGCNCCIDIAHVLARYGKYEFEKIKDAFKQKAWHVHFSGIEYGDKGERNHKLTPTKDWKRVLDFLKTLDKDVVIICESPDPVGDSIVGMDIFKG